MTTSELHDLAKDPQETRNVYGDPNYANVKSQLKRELKQLRAAYGESDKKYPELVRIINKHWD